MENFLFLSIVNYHGIIYYFNFVKRMSANDSDMKAIVMIAQVLSGLITLVK